MKEERCERCYAQKWERHAEYCKGKNCECFESHNDADVTKDSCGCCMSGHMRFIATQAKGGPLKVTYYNSLTPGEMKEQMEMSSVTTATTCECTGEGVSQCNDCHDGVHCMGTVKGCGEKENQPLGWEKEFDEKWVRDTAFSTVIAARGVLCQDAEEIKSFIRDLLQKTEKEAYWEGIKVMEEECDRALKVDRAKEETIGEASYRNKKWFDRGMAQERAEIEKIVLELKGYSEPSFGFAGGYHKALTDLLEKLRARV